MDDLFANLCDDRDFQLAMVEEGLLHRVALRTIHFRKTKRLSQKALAKRMGTKQPAIARIEAGDTNLTLRTLAQLAFALERVPEDFVTDRVLYRGGEAWGEPNVRLVRAQQSVSASAQPSGYEVSPLGRKAV